MLTSEDAEFLEEIRRSPNDDTPRLIYADWLEEQGDVRAEYLRLECEVASLGKHDALYVELRPRLMELRGQIDIRWITAVGRTRVANCPHRGTNCPKHWEALMKTGNPRQRFCLTCESLVHFCETAGMLHYHLERAVPVAIDTVTKVEPADFTIR